MLARILYDLASGPLAWIAFAVFVVGSLYMLSKLAELAKKKDGYVYAYWSWPHVLRSLFHWFLPFGARNWRLNPVMTVATFLFHFAMIILPFLILGHISLFEESFGIMLWNPLPDVAVDALAWGALASCLFFLARRLVRPEVRFVTSGEDFVLLALAAAPFVTGIMAYRAWGDPTLMLALHMLCGEALLCAIPFPRLGHAILAIFVRGHTASEFGAVRHIKDW
jgi:nitrate reductase gamma subunit